MEGNLIEIKRFLKDQKVFITIGSIIVSILFTLAMIFIDMNKEETTQEGQEDFEFSPAEVMNEAQPAYFQFYLESEDGIAYGNSSIFNQYFNLKSIKDDAQQVTKVDIEEVEEELNSKELNEEISIISITRNDSSYLFTASFNLGNERNNLKIAQYYFDLLLKDEMGLLEDKNTYIFSEPTIAKVSNEKLAPTEQLEAGNRLTDNNFVSYIKNIIVGFVLGIVFTIGLMLLKVIYGKKLSYSFAYDVAESDKFILYDKKLKNKEIVSQFIGAPFGTPKIIVSEYGVDAINLKKIIGNKRVTFNNSEKEKTLLIEMESLSEIEIARNISEVIIVISPQITTRKWYKTQQQLASINGLMTKIIQIND